MAARTPARNPGANSGSGAGAGGPGGSVETGNSDQAASYSPGSVPGDMPPSPSAARLLAENALSADAVDGSGRRGQVLKGDVIAALESGATAKSKDAPRKAPARAPSRAEDEPREERVRMTRLRQTIARRLKDAQDSAAMLTTFNEVDMGAVMDLRTRYKELFEKKHGVKLGFMGFFTKAVCHALKEIPAVNAEIDGTDIVYKNFAHIGVAVGTDKGLVVPVVRDAGRHDHRRDRARDRPPRPRRARRRAVDGGHAGRHVHHLQRRRLRLAHVHPHPQRAPIGHPGDAQDPGAARWP